MNIISYYKRLILFNLKKKTNLSIIKKYHNLDHLFKIYKTDKSSKSHGFADYYEKHLLSFKNRKIVILEIGSLFGSSAAAFNSYFNNCKIYCLDNHIENFNFKSKNLFPVLINSSDENSIKKFYKKLPLKCPEFDIIIDDGSHRLRDIIYSLKYHFKHLKQNGFFVIEDYLFPNYFKNCNDTREFKIDKLLNQIKKKKNFKSDILSYDDQNYLFDNVDKIFTYKGLTTHSDICFIKKK